MNGSGKSENGVMGKIKKSSPPGPPPSSPSVKKVESSKYKSVRVQQEVQEEDEGDQERYTNDALSQVRSRLRRLNAGGNPRSPHSREL